MADDLTLGQKVPNKSERDAAGAIAARIVRGTPEFAKLVEYDKGNVVFKDEEGTGADRMMSPRLRDAMAKLAKSVAAEFTGVKLRVTEAWDENGEHASGSLHYEGRAADLTTSDRDAGKLGRLGRLAVEAGFDWVFYEDSSHVHVAARKEGSGTPMEALAAEDAGGGWVARRFELEIGALLAAMEEERASISIVGRALTDEESVQLTRIQRALPLLEEAHEIFTGAAPSGGGGSHLHAPAPPAGEGEEEDPPAEHALAAPESDSPAVAAALAALSPRVTARSHPDALRIAFQAYHNFRAARPGELRNPYLYYVDYGLDNRTPRGYVFDMDALTVVDGPFCVAHGRGSSAVRDAVPTVFSDRPRSAATSLGLYVTRETYEFNGKYGGGKKYRSVGLRLSGESGPFNHNALARGVVAHGAPYVTDRDAGRSEGCPAMAEPRARRLLPMLARGGAVFHFSPRDQGWLSGDPWISPR